MSEGLHRFYRLEPGTRPVGSPKWPLGCAPEYWRPRWWRPLPPQPWRPAFWVWALFKYLGVFRSKYGVLVVRQGGRVVHRSCVFPRFFRFPFMQSRDLQIGDVWTTPEARGRGMAAAAITAIRREAGADAHLWWVVEDSNSASIRVAEKAGFELVGFGRKLPRLGVGLLGCYEIESRVRPTLVAGRSAE